MGGVILVTGAASGIGAATCRRLAGPGTAIVLHTRRSRSVETVAEAVTAAGSTAHIVYGDLAEPATAAALIETALALGSLETVIANAGFADRTPIAALSDEAWAKSQDTILGGSFRLARAALPHLQRAAHGRFIAVGSFVAHAFRTHLPGFPASAAAKAGLLALVRALALELAPSGATANAVVPGLIRKDAQAHAALDATRAAHQTAHIPLGRLGTPDDVAHAIAFLASPQASYITGQALHVDGGLVT